MASFSGTPRSSIWHFVGADNKLLGRLCQPEATGLRGLHTRAAAAADFVLDELVSLQKSGFRR